MVGVPAATPARRPGTSEQLLLRLEWTVLKRLDGLLQGDYRSLWRGAGLDLADLREYQHGDDVRRIDWATTARLQQPHVRLYREDREVAVWFLLDLSASIDFGSGERSKLDLAEQFTGVLARVMGRQGNPVGAVLYRPVAGQGASTLTLPPRSGRNQVLQLLSRLRTQASSVVPGNAAPDNKASTNRPARSDGKGVTTRQPGIDGQTRLADLLQAAESMIRRRSVVVVVSDFISEPGWSNALGRLARRHDVLAVRLTDPLDRALPDFGLLTVQDAETGEQLLVDTADPAFRRRFAEQADKSEAELLDDFGRAGVDTLELATDEDLLAALLRFVALRRQAGNRHASLADRAAVARADAGSAQARAAAVADTPPIAAAATSSPASPSARPPAVAA
ncbi:MAG: DUF58 domain-containing protein [Burkholderiales bacterium]|nr:DUF58 domain-containing protein [Burkholderiales bacterium]